MASDDNVIRMGQETPPYCTHLMTCKEHSQADDLIHDAGEKISTWAEGLRDLLHNVVLAGNKDECDLGVAILALADAALWAIATRAQTDVYQQSAGPGLEEGE